MDAFKGACHMALRFFALNHQHGAPGDRAGPTCRALQARVQDWRVRHAFASAVLRGPPTSRCSASLTRI
eukprot:2028092-Pyramimonas_sp.AAC.1